MLPADQFTPPAEPVLDFEESLYLADPGEMLDLVRSVPDTVETLLLVAHNPGTGMLAAALAGDGARRGFISCARSSQPRDWQLSSLVSIVGKTL